MLFSKLIYFSWKSTASVLPTLRGIRGFSRFATIHENNSNGSDSRISIGIVGTGAIGSYYGARLWERRDLYNVKFHMRSAENFDACQDHGLQVKVKFDCWSPLFTYSLRVVVHFVTKDFFLPCTAPYKVNSWRYIHSSIGSSSLQNHG
mmetsp:Transcript_11455/g.16456  ORF Transcript_11455/g.16456 Transcript_11455/m.16456 type:complete len:148 (+) Transcript_11455:197-640(+)